MKSAWKTVLISLVLLALLTRCEREPEKKPENLMPDTHFLYALIQKGVDANGDHKINQEEAEVLDFLDVSYCSISDLNGIEMFVNLEKLLCSNNRLTLLDLSGNASLQYLDCHSNQLSSLNVSDNRYLSDLNCSKNQLTFLDISNNGALISLNCDANQLTSLDVSGNPGLSTLLCAGNLISSLDVTNLIDLNVMSCGGNRLTILDIANNMSLGLEEGEWISCFLVIGDMPELEQVCVWRLPFPPANFSLCAEGSPNVVFTTTCSK